METMCDFVGSKGLTEETDGSEFGIQNLWRAGDVYKRQGQFQGTTIQRQAHEPADGIGRRRAPGWDSAFWG